MDFLQALNENLCSLEMSEVLAAIEEAIEGRLLTAEDVQPSNFTSEKDLEREEFLAVKVSPIPIDGVSYRACIAHSIVYRAFILLPITLEDFMSKIALF